MLIKSADDKAKRMALQEGLQESSLLHAGQVSGTFLMLRRGYQRPQSGVNVDNGRYCCIKIQQNVVKSYEQASHTKCG
jgi:hypothetical protein